MHKSEKKVIFVNKDEFKPSRYKVDLLSQELKKEAKKKQRNKHKIKKKANKKTKTNAYVSVQGEMIEFTDFDRKTGSYFNDRVANILRVFKRSNKQAWRTLSLVKLSFFIFRLLRKVFYFLELISYWTGWIVIFVLRLVYLPFKFVFIYYQNTINKYLVAKTKIKHNKIRQNFTSEISNKASKASLMLDFRGTNGLEDSFKHEEKDSAPEISGKYKNQTGKKRFYPHNSLATLTWADILPSPSMKNFRPAVSFAVIIFILVLPLKALTFYYQVNSTGGKVLGVSVSAIDEMRKGAEQLKTLQFSKAGGNFLSASTNFSEARRNAGFIFSVLAVLAKVVPNKKVQLGAEAKHILRAGELGSLIAGHFSRALALATNTADKNLGEILKSILGEFKMAEQNLNKLDAEIKAINADNIPSEYREQFLAVQNRTDMLSGSLHEMTQILDLGLKFTGVDGSRRYLLAFQNNYELRASGGFLGSFALVDFKNGKLSNIEVPSGGSYDTEAGMLDVIAPPKPLSLIAKRWYFWDANWWPDWPTTAKKLMWFYEKSDGPSVDGVISFTPTVIEDLLKITGPIDLREKYNVVINSDNFWQVTQTFAEQKPHEHPAYKPNPYLPDNNEAKTATGTLADENKPKKIIGDMFNEILRILPKDMTQEKLLSLLNLMENSLIQKQAMVYFNDEEVEKSIIDLGWDGGIKKSDWDYLMVVDTNIGGGKSDKAIDEDIKHNIEINPDGSVIDTLTITRTHKAKKGEEFTGVRNIDWIRVYVPLGSKLIKAKGFMPPKKDLFETITPGAHEDPYVAVTEGNAIRDDDSWTYIYNESGKTVFANWSQLEPGDSVTVELKYKLPFNLLTPEENLSIMDSFDDLLQVDKKTLHRFALTLQKQPGTLNRNFSLSLHLPNNCQNFWAYPDFPDGITGDWINSQMLNSDSIFATIIKCVAKNNNDLIN